MEHLEVVGLKQRLRRHVWLLLNLSPKVSTQGVAVVVSYVILLRARHGAAPRTQKIERWYTR